MRCLQTLLQYRNQLKTYLDEELLKELHALSLLRGPGLQSSASPDAGIRVLRHQKRCARKRKCGNRGGVLGVM
ncbi:hypothetical protein chiPu_0001942 [Chiloscyllium punctatum]|uniref:Uncharacterized protein n=1 Tax=Chiloscyllium punctatum TaxID=137246 RepID=A0A401RZG6_CHIPU|nr:hypothetical protein [Chiloscyllium punctatum]